MLTVPELNLGSVDAINYKTKEQKEFFAKVLYREDYLEEVLRPEKYFLIGEKGTGKTSYAVFLHNSEYGDTLSRAVSLSQTDYRRFIALMALGKFTVSSYVDIWRVILLLLVSDGIANRFPDSAFGFPKFKQLKDAIDEYYHSAFRPEVDQSLDIIENSETAAGLMAKYAELKQSEGTTVKENFPSFQVSLAFIERKFKEALGSLRLSKNFILFVDGIDIRPDQIEFEEYIECIKGLANAAWELNTEFFGNIKGAKRHMRVVLLMRPDILDRMSFQNLNAKVHDNGVVLNWATSYDAFRKSPIFKLVSGIIAKQQDITNDPYGVWKHYFPYEYENLRIAEKLDDPFVGLLRYSFYRPRDIIRYLQLMQAEVKREEEDKTIFSRESFFAAQRDFSEYLLGEVKDYLAFYHSSVDFNQIVGFFSEFGGKNSFSWIEFQSAFHRYSLGLASKKATLPELTRSPEDLLQFLYSLNMVGFMEPDPTGHGHFVHYCFRDRTTAKLRPQVRFGLKYQVHPGLQRALLVGGENRSQENRRGRRRRRRGHGRPRENSATGGYGNRQ